MWLFFSPKCSQMVTKGLKISIFTPFTTGGTYALKAAKIQRFRPMQVFLDTKFRFQTMFPLSPIKAALSLDPQTRVSSLLYMFSGSTFFYFSKQVCKTIVDFSHSRCYNTLIPKGIENHRRHIWKLLFMELI